MNWSHTCMWSMVLPRPLQTNTTGLPWSPNFPTPIHQTLWKQVFKLNHREEGRRWLWQDAWAVRNKLLYLNSWKGSNFRSSCNHDVLCCNNFSTSIFLVHCNLQSVLHTSESDPCSYEVTEAATNKAPTGQMYLIWTCDCSMSIYPSNLQCNSHHITL